MVPNTRELLPEPETPVNTVSRRFGISMLTSLRLLTRAPERGSGRAGPRSAATCPPASGWCGPSARCLLHELGDPLLRAWGQLGHGERDRPHLTVVDAGVGLEAERR